MNLKPKTAEISEIKAITDELEIKERELIEAKKTIKMLESKLERSEAELYAKCSMAKKQNYKLADENNLLRLYQTISSGGNKAEQNNH